MSSITESNIIAASDPEAAHETIRKVVEEGLEARNLLNFMSDVSLDEKKVCRKPPTSPRPQSVSPKPPSFELNKGINARLLPRSSKRRNALPRPKSRLRSASAGRNPEKDLRARYWTFLFENLHRAVDEIYQTCEMDESIVESKEAIMMLENYSKDFHALIQYININKDYEKAAPTDRPTSLAWEVRKSSPGKSLLKNVFIEKLTTGNTAKRLLCFESEGDVNPSSKLQNFPLSQQNGKVSDTSGIHIGSFQIKEDEVMPLNVSNELEKECDVKISVVSVPADPNFPCNESLVINEVCCEKAKIPLLETQCENEIDAISAEEKEFVKTNNKINTIKSNQLTKNNSKEDLSNSSSIEKIESLPQNENLCNGTTKSKVSETKKCNQNPTKTKLLMRRSKSSMSETTSINKTSAKKIDIKSLKKPSLEKNVKEDIPSNVKDKIKDYQAKQNSTNGISHSSSDSKLQLKIENNLNSENRSVKELVSTLSVSKKNVSSVLSQHKDNTLSSSTSTKPTTKGSNTNWRNLTPRATAKPEALNTSNLKKTSVKSTTEKTKPLNSNSAESAIKRNISYVQSLSSRNQQEKSANIAKKPSRPLSGNLKASQKSGSMTCLSRTLNNRLPTRKTLSVEKIPEAVKNNTDEDSDGWETVRSRNRSRNSPAKKIPFLNKHLESEAVQIAKLNQSRIGGFPYTNKSNLKTSLKSETPKKCGKQNVKSNEKLLKTQDKSSPSNKIDDSSKSSATRPITLDIDLQKNNSKENLSNDSHSKKIWLSEISKKFSNVLKCDNFHSNRLSRSSSTPMLYSKFDISSYKLSKALSLSDQSLESQKYKNINIFKKRVSERGSNSAKKKSKKSKISNEGSSEIAKMNGSLDESDNGLTSDDQDGTMSHDEFDAHCQELDDSTWKYKILEQQVRKLELSWGEQMDLFDMELRTPGRALEMHEKLSSPFRKKSLLESIRLCNEKQLKAQEQRERLLEEKAQKFKIIEKKRLEMKALLEERQEKQRILMKQKLQRAEEKRKKQLQMIKRKAHDEEEKVNEIAFINTLEAQNKRHDLISKEKDHEARLQDIQEERQRKQEEKAAKEAAAEERRKVLEAERLARLNEMQEKRKMRDHKVEQLFLVKEKERQELANQKARERELRLSALNAQHQTQQQELQKKIQLKQEESARRHEENMEQIRQKAFELSIRRCSSNNDDVPQTVPYDRKKICTMCNVLIGSEVYLLSHLHGKKHQEAVKAHYHDKDPSSEELELYNLKHIVDASTDQLDPNIALDKERQKALKKRCKKLRQRMSNRGQDYESEYFKTAASINSNVKNKMERILSDLKKFSTAKDKNGESNMFAFIERCLNDIDSMLKKQLMNNKPAFQASGGITALVDIFGIISNQKPGNNSISNRKAIIHLSSTTEYLVDKSLEVCKFVLFSNKIGNLLDFLLYRLNCSIPDNISQLIANSMTKSGELNIRIDIAAWKLIHVLTTILINLSVTYTCIKSEEKSSEFQIRMQDMISYIVSIGIIDKLSQFFNSILVPISNEEEVSGFLLDCIHFLTTLIKLSADCFSGSVNQKTDDTTQLVATFRVTNMVGVVSFLYSLLLHNGSSTRSEDPPPQLSKQIEILAHSSIQMFNHMAMMNLQAFQSILGSEGLSLQLRHIVSHLLWYCSHLTAENLLHEIIILVGYFTVLNPENQSIIQAGQRPTVLQQLCCLPFLYFSEPELTDILFPTLIACCFNKPENKAILQQEMTSELLSNYIEVKYLNLDDDDISKKNKINTVDISFNKYYSFSIRFPKCHWSSAKNYFSVQ